MTQGNPKCPSCKGEGYLLSTKYSELYKAEIPLWKRCPCLKDKLVIDHLKDLANFPNVPDSPLYTKLSKNLFLYSTLNVFRSHLRYCIEKSGTSLLYLYLTDSRLLDIWLGKDPDFKTLQDLERFDLLIVLLGYQGYTNIALPGIIMQTLNIRILKNSPTWVHSYRSFNVSQTEYSQDLEEILKQNFEYITIGTKLGVTQASLASPEAKSSKKLTNASINQMLG